ncbi:MAG: TonB family protein [Vicinamibacterales bacterium]
MKRTPITAVATSIVCFAALVTAHAQDASERGFEPVTRWTTERAVPDVVPTAEGVLSVTDAAGWVRTQAPFGDITLRFEVQTPPTGTQAVLVVRGRSASGSTPGAGFALPLAGDTAAAMAALSDMRLEVPEFSPDYLAKALGPPGEWQQYEILCEGDLVTVTINGLVIFSERRLREAEGWIGVRSEGGPVALRNVRTRPELPGPPGQRRIDVAVEGDAVQINPWLPGFMQELMRRWPNPSEAKSLKGRVEVTLSVQKNGTIGDVIVRPSPIEAFNKAARQAVAKAKPKPLPASYSNARAQLIVTFVNNEYTAPVHAIGVYRTNPVSVPVLSPRLLRQTQPQYTREALQARIQGTVVLECVIKADGTVGDIRVVQSLDRRFGLDEEAIAAARQWRFEPGTRLGQPVAVLARCELDFKIRNGQR